MPENDKHSKSKLFTTLHGVLIDIRGLGVLIVGPSGIGKSDCAIELISSKGCKLVSDDIVDVRTSDSGHLIGTAPDRTRHLMEVRGVGIVNIKDLYGADSVIIQKQIDMVVELCLWDSNSDYDRLGIDDKSYKILETDVPYSLIPITPNRNIPTIIEVAVLNQLYKLSDSNNKDMILHQLENVKAAAAGIK